MKNIREKPKQMRKVYELWADVYTGDEYDYRSEKSLIATYDSKEFAEKEEKRLDEAEERRNKGFPDHFYIRSKLMETDYTPNITDVSYYPNLQDALDTLMKRDSNHVFLRHELSKNKGIEKHKHMNYDEWVVFRDGKLEIMLDSRSQIVDSTDLKEYCSVYFPKNKNHSVKTLSKINYYVLRDKKR